MVGTIGTLNENFMSEIWCSLFYTVYNFAVIFPGLDGFGGSYLKNVSYRYPALQSFFDFGAFSTECRNVAPTVSNL